MYTITFKLHSFVDLITNSSSEVFVCATDKTISTLHEVINHILKASNQPQLKSEQLFDIKLAVNVEDVYNEETKKYTSETYLKGSEGFNEAMEYQRGQVTIKVNPIIDNVDVVAAANVLNKLKDTFDGVEVSC